MKPLVLILTFSLTPSIGLAQTPMADSLTLEKVIHLVVERNPSVSRTAKSIEAAQAAVEISRSRYYPDASVEISYERIAPVAEIDFPGLGTFLLFPANNYDGHVGIKQKIYDFNKTAESVNFTSSRVQLARDRMEETKRNLAYAVVQSFYTALFLDQSIRVQDEQITRLNEYLGVTRNKLATGSATDFDVLTTRVRIAAAQDRKIDLQNRLQHEEIALRRLADLPPLYPLYLSGGFQVEQRGTNPDSLFDLAQRQREDYRTVLDGVRSAEVQVNLAGTNSNPSLNFNAAYGVKNGYIPNLDVLRGNYVAGVSLEVTIFDGYKTSSMSEEAQANLLAAQEQKREAETQMHAEIQQAIVDLDASAEKLQNSRLSVEQAESAAEMARVKYDSGVITNLDLLDAGTALEEARLNHLRAQYSWVLSQYELRKSIGEQIW